MAKTMTEEHKRALAEGRQTARDVKAYLEALEQNKPKRGRKRTPDSIQARLEAIETEIDDAGALQALNLVQERKDLSVELEKLTSEAGPDMEALEAGFAKSAKAYGQSKGISYGTWREVGVPADLLKRAGIARTRG